MSMSRRFMTGGFREVMASFVAHCETTGQVADRLGLADSIRRSLSQALERWDGKGGPAGLRGEQIQRVMRVAQIAQEAEVFCRVSGVKATIEMINDRKGRQFDPQLVELCAAHADVVFGGLDEVSTWSAVIDGCASLDRQLDEAELHRVLEAFGDYADLKSPWFLGHSRALAALAAAAAKHCRLPSAEVRQVELAALVCRVGVIDGDLESGRPVERDRTRARPHRPLPNGTDAAPRSGAGRRRRYRGSSPRTHGRLGISAGPFGCGHPADGTRAGRS
jgi:HD-GYP domain-containing protein (c-di-GMP phosphodiesterase class II)